MSYKKQNFVDGNPLYAAELNHIEDGISALDLDVQALKNQGTPEDGEDGYSPTVEISKSGKVTTVKITDKDGTKTATINDGADGKTPVKGTDYVDGTDGVGIKSVVQTTTSSADGGSNVITVTKTDNTTSTFTVKNGSKGNKGDTPVKGTDYFTEADKAEMVQAVLEALPAAEGVAF